MEAKQNKNTIHQGRIKIDKIIKAPQITLFIDAILAQRLKFGENKSGGLHPPPTHYSFDLNPKNKKSEV